VVLSGARCRSFAYGPADATCHPKTPSPVASFKSIPVLPFWYRLNQVVAEKRALNGCSSSNSSRRERCRKSAKTLQSVFGASLKFAENFIIIRFRSVTLLNVKEVICKLNKSDI